MVEEPVLPVEEYRREMIRKRFEVTVKECHSIMKVGWESEV